ncbi:pilin [Patescibacteria group bacterium]|nr:pilin [Patescibacteria group bacterium]
MTTKIKKYMKAISVGLVGVFALALLVPAAVDASTNSDPLKVLNETAKQSGQTSSRDLPEVVGNIIQWVLGIVGIVLLVMFVYGGVLYATSAGNEDKVDTAKKVMLYAIIGVIIIALAFVLTRYIISALFVSA